MASSALEIIIAADDGRDYGFLRQFWPNLRLAPRHAFKSGPGAARNRGLALARGHVIGFLDADDRWSEGYLKSMLPLTRKHGLAFARSHICRSDGATVCSLGPAGGWLRLADFGTWPGSFHPMVMAGSSPGFDHGPAQDVLHAMRLVAMAGGRAALARPGFYQINLREGSVTASPDFAHRIDRRYRDMIVDFASPEGRQAINQRRRWNKRWLQADPHPSGFYGYFSQNNKK